MKVRVKNIIKKPATWVVAASVVLAVALVIIFTVNRHSADGSSGENADADIRLTLDDVKKLAKKGDALKFGDFSGFKGVDVSSNKGYHIMLYGVEGGYRLIVRTDGDQIDGADLERIWDNGGSGIDIRRDDVYEFVKSHPSAESITGWRGIEIGAPRDEVQRIMGEPEIMTSGLWSEGYYLIDGSIVIFLYKNDGSVSQIRKSIGKKISSIETVRQSDEKKWTLSDADTIKKFADALNNRQRTNSEIDIRPRDFSVKIIFDDNSYAEYDLWIDEDINARGVLMGNDSTWYINSEVNPLFKEILR